MEESQFFVLPEDDDGFVTLTHLAYSSGRDEWRTTIFDEQRLQQQDLGGQIVFPEFPRRESGEVRIFEKIASPDTTRYPLSEDVAETVEAFARDLNSPSTWENSILSSTAIGSAVLTNISQLCRTIKEKEDGDLAAKADKILELLDENTISDWAENQLRTVYRRRRRYGTTGTIDRLYHKLTQEIELTEPETVTDVDVALTGKFGDDKVDSQ